MTSLTSIPKVDYTTTPHPSGVVALSLKDAPALIEHLLSVQKLSIDIYKERMAGSSQTLTALGGYWKGRKPLVLNRACVLASLLPATDNQLKDLEVFELLMGMDDISLSKRLGLAKPEEILRVVALDNIEDYFVVDPPELAGYLPKSAPMDLRSIPYFKDTGLPTLRWRSGIGWNKQHALSARVFEKEEYRSVAKGAKRSEDVKDISSHVWGSVNAHLGTNAFCIEELIEQLGVMRFGHRPTVADGFSGSGQIPFSAAQVGCDVYASDLNPMASLLTWGAFNIVGASDEKRSKLEAELKDIEGKLYSAVDALEIETDNNGWRSKVYLYCVEVICPSSGWKVPVLPSFVVSAGRGVIVQLVPDHANKRYGIVINNNASAAELKAAENGTYRKNSVVHTVDGVEHISSISSIRQDYTEMIGGKKFTKNKLRLWEKADSGPRDHDIFAERLYAIQWIKEGSGARPITEFRTVTEEDLIREQRVICYVKKHLADWQEKGWLPDMVIEAGDKTSEPIRTRGWTHWHHLWGARHLLTLGLIRQNITSPELAVIFAGVLDYSSKLSRWTTSGIRVAKDGSGAQVGGASNGTSNVFYNQALNTLYNYGARATFDLMAVFKKKIKSSPLLKDRVHQVENLPASSINTLCDIWVTDPPYGDAVKYEEILEFFIAWFRKAPLAVFSSWNWDSRRELAVKGEGHDFRLSMVAAYKRMGECMPDNGLQILMFTHQSGNIWADMANIVWASGLRVTAAWYLVTETDSALRDGSYVKGTILLVLRKRVGKLRTNQTDLAYELEDEVGEQIKRLTGLNQTVAANSLRAKDGNLFEDADLQMAGYAAALKVLTTYSIIDGKDMTQEALRPRVAGQTTLVESLIDFAVNTANKALVPHGLPETIWHDLNPAERFYLKMLDMECQGLHSLDNYQNFAKAFSVRDWKALMQSERANAAALRSAVELGRSEMNQTAELFETPTRAVLYALMELQVEKDLDVVLDGLEQNLKVNTYYSSRDLIVGVSRFIAKKLETIRPEEAQTARILADGIENQKL